MTIHPMPSRANRIKALTRNGLPPRYCTLVAHGLLPPEPPRRSGTAPARQLSSGERVLRQPLIAAHLDLRGPAINWSHPCLQRRLSPEPTVQVGVLSSIGLMPLAKRYRLSLHKISVILKTQEDFQKRIHVLREDRYASRWQSSEGSLIEDRNFDRWQLNTLPVVKPSSIWSPVKARLRYLDIRLPIGVDYKMFDNALTEALATARVDVWAGTQSGKDDCARISHDPADLIRFTAYDMGGTEPYMRQATEIVHFKPDQQTWLLMIVIEEVLLRLAGWIGPAPQ